MNKKKNKRAGKKRWPYVVGSVLLVIGLWHLFTNFYREEEKAIRSQLRETVDSKFPDQRDSFYRTFGLSTYGENPDASDGPDLGRKTVILVHGLDDPGKVWQDLAPALAREDGNVWLMHYPNDQPITASALLFFEELKGLKRRGIRRIAIVAHSMGGLVSREMLTHPDIAYGQAAETGQVPGVSLLIMVGTPNHGSQMARFRLFGEIRDQLTRLSKGEASWLGGVFDGAGEAKIDLLPGSRFLTGLNGRPHPQGVDMLIIAGIITPWNERDIAQWVDRLRSDSSGDHQEEFGALAGYITSMTYGLGDGLVTVESTRLKGVPHRTVSGTHLSMIRNIAADNPRVPPAVPIIVDHVKRKE